MSDALIQSLTDQLAKANREAATRRHTSKSLQARVDTLTKALDEATTERESLRTGYDALKASSAAAPGDKDRKIAELQGQVWTRDHKDVFSKAAVAKGAKPEAIDDLFALSGYKAEGDQVDAAAIDALVGTLATSRPYAFQGVTPPATPTKTTLPAGPGAERGDPARSGGSYSVRRSDASDATWMAANQGQLAAAVKAGTVVWTD